MSSASALYLPNQNSQIAENSNRASGHLSERSTPKSLRQKSRVERRRSHVEKDRNQGPVEQQTQDADTAEERSNPTTVLELFESLLGGLKQESSSQVLDPFKNKPVEVAKTLIKITQSEAFKNTYDLQYSKAAKEKLHLHQEKYVVQLNCYKFVSYVLKIACPEALKELDTFMEERGQIFHENVKKTLFEYVKEEYGKLRPQSSDSFKELNPEGSGNGGAESIEEFMKKLLDATKVSPPKIKELEYSLDNRVKEETRELALDSTIDRSLDGMPTPAHAVAFWKCLKSGQTTEQQTSKHWWGALHSPNDLKAGDIIAYQPEGFALPPVSKEAKDNPKSGGTHMMIVSGKAELISDEAWKVPIIECSNRNKDRPIISEGYIYLEHDSEKEPENSRFFVKFSNHRNSKSNEGIPKEVIMRMEDEEKSSGDHQRSSRTFNAPSPLGERKLPSTSSSTLPQEAEQSAKPAKRMKQPNTAGAQNGHSGQSAADFARTPASSSSQNRHHVQQHLQERLIAGGQNGYSFNIAYQNQDGANTNGQNEDDMLMSDDCSLDFAVALDEGGNFRVCNASSKFQAQGHYQMQSLEDNPLGSRQTLDESVSSEDSRKNNGKVMEFAFLSFLSPKSSANLGAFIDSLPENKSTDPIGGALTYSELERAQAADPINPNEKQPGGRKVGPASKGKRRGQKGRRL